MKELDDLKVYGSTSVGWDEKTPPNETVDKDGRPLPDDRGFGLPDPRAPSQRVYDHPEVERLRRHLRSNNGIRGLEICSPDEVERATRIFRRDGFVVVRNLLSAEQLAELREGCARVLRELLSIPGLDGRKYITESGRLPHRYSYGTSSSTRQMMHDATWAAVIDLPTTTPILRAIFGTDDYLVWGGGGDLCLPGAIEYQHLHSDVGDPQTLDPKRLESARRLGLKIDPDKTFDELDLRTQRLVMDRTPPLVTINFLMSDLTWENGPIRQIPGTHTATASPPKPIDEPEWMRLSTLVGAAAGSGVFRDNRAWHGATPNLSREIRAMPNIEYSGEWRPESEFQRTMPDEIWSSLSRHAQHICRRIKLAPDHQRPAAIKMHPLATAREQAE